MTTKDATPTVTFDADLSVADGLTITCKSVSPGKNVEFDVCVGDDNYYRVGIGSVYLYPRNKPYLSCTEA